MRTVHALLLLVIVLFQSFNANAQDDNSLECGGSQTGYFLNGVNVITRHDALESMADMMPALRSNISDDSVGTRFSVAYNRSLAGLRSDILETARQILGNEYPCATYFQSIV